MKSTDEIERAEPRVTNRMPQAVAQKLQEAADLTGATLNQFMVQASLEKAERIIDREKTIPLSAKDAAMLLHMLDNPAKPNAALARAFKRFKQREAENGNQNRGAGEHP
jgi:uncharacterized protein (DUF1778 family)